MNFVVITFRTECVHNAAGSNSNLALQRTIRWHFLPQAFNASSARALAVIRAGRSES